MKLDHCVKARRVIYANVCRFWGGDAKDASKDLRSVAAIVVPTEASSTSDALRGCCDYAELSHACKQRLSVDVVSVSLWKWLVWLLTGMCVAVTGEEIKSRAGVVTCDVVSIIMLLVMPGREFDIIVAVASLMQLDGFAEFFILEFLISAYCFLFVGKDGFVVTGFGVVVVVSFVVV